MRWIISELWYVCLYECVGLLHTHLHMFMRPYSVCAVYVCVPGVCVCVCVRARVCVHIPYSVKHWQGEIWAKSLYQLFERETLAN